MTISAKALAAPESGEVELLRAPEESAVAAVYAAIYCALPALACLVFGLYRWAAIAAVAPLLLLIPWLNGRRIARRVAVQVFARAAAPDRGLGLRLALREDPPGTLLSVEAGLSLAEVGQAVEAGSTTPTFEQSVVWAKTRRLERDAIAVIERAERPELGARLEIALPDRLPPPLPRDGVWNGSRLWCVTLVLHGPRGAVARWRFDVPKGHAWTDLGLPPLPDDNEDAPPKA